MEKSADAFRTISEVADELRLPQHVLRFWETRFPQIRPLKRAGGRRYYRPVDTLLLRTIRQLLYEEGYTIKGVQRLLKEQGARRLSEAGASTNLAIALNEPGDGAEEGDAGLFQAEAVEHGGALDVTGGRGQPMPREAPAMAPSMTRDPSDRVPPNEAVRASVVGADALREALAIVDACLGILHSVR